MSTPLKTGEESVYRQHPYTPVEIVEFSGANPDTSDIARAPGAFKEMHNMRFEQPGTPTTRTGYRKFTLGGFPV
jgi:hypothetical protein